MLTGQAKRDYQREYMREYMRSYRQKCRSVKTPLRPIANPGQAINKDLAENQPELDAVGNIIPEW